MISNKHGLIFNKHGLISTNTLWSQTITFWSQTSTLWSLTITFWSQTISFWSQTSTVSSQTSIVWSQKAQCDLKQAWFYLDLKSLYIYDQTTPNHSSNDLDRTNLAVYKFNFLMHHFMFIIFYSGNYLTTVEMEDLNRLNFPEPISLVKWTKTWRWL